MGWLQLVCDVLGTFCVVLLTYVVRIYVSYLQFKCGSNIIRCVIVTYKLPEGKTPQFQVCSKETSYYFTIKIYFMLPYQNNNRDFTKQSLYCISFCMKSFNPNSFLSESLTHARKMEVGICEGRGLGGGGDEEREVA